MAPVNLERLLEGMKRVRVKGRADSQLKKDVLEKAILEYNINTNSATQFAVKKFGMREMEAPELVEGTSPIHGQKTLEICLADTVAGINEDGLYLLETVLANPEFDVWGMLEQVLSDRANLKKSEDRFKLLTELQF